MDFPIKWIDEEYSLAKREHKTLILIFAPIMLGFCFLIIGISGITAYNVLILQHYLNNTLGFNLSVVRIDLYNLTKINGPLKYSLNYSLLNKTALVQIFYWNEINKEYGIKCKGSDFIGSCGYTYSIGTGIPKLNGSNSIIINDSFP